MRHWITSFRSLKMKSGYAIDVAAQEGLPYRIGSAGLKGMLFALKGLPFAYHRDLVEDDWRPSTRSTSLSPQ